MVEVSFTLNPYRRAKTRYIDWRYWCELTLDRFFTWVILFVVYRLGKKVGAHGGR